MKDIWSTDWKENTFMLRILLRLGRKLTV